MSNRLHFRDEGLGAALRELHVPPHRPGFEQELGELLAREQRPRRWTQLRPRGLAAAAAALAAVAVVFAVTRLASSPALASRVQAKAAAAFANGRTMRGVIVWRSQFGQREVSRWSFAMTARGDLRATALDGSADSVYLASTGVLRGLNASSALGSAHRFASVVTGVPPGPPDGGPAQDEFIQRRLGAVVRVLVAADDPRVRTTVFEGRKAWRVALPTQPNRAYADYDRLDVTIDQKTGIVLRAVYTLHGKFRSELRVVRFAVDRPLPPKTFRLVFPRGEEVLRSDEGFRRVPLRRAASTVGYAPLVPHSVPAGYRLADVAVARKPANAAQLDEEPPSRDVVSLSYRRGFDEFLVTTRRRGSGTWRDPLRPPQGSTGHPQRVRLHGGALDGITAELDVDLRTTPHLWALTPTLVVTVSGDLARDELLAVAQSLR